MRAINNKPSLTAVGPRSLYTELTGKHQETSSLHQASYNILILKEVFYKYVKNHWISTFESFIQLNSEVINISRIRQSIMKTRSCQMKKPNKIGLSYLNGLQ